MIDHRGPPIIIVHEPYFFFFRILLLLLLLLLFLILDLRTHFTLSNHLSTSSLVSSIAVVTLDDFNSDPHCVWVNDLFIVFSALHWLETPVEALWVVLLVLEDKVGVILIPSLSFAFLLVVVLSANLLLKEVFKVPLHVLLLKLIASLTTAVLLSFLSFILLALFIV